MRTTLLAVALLLPPSLSHGNWTRRQTLGPPPPASSTHSLPSFKPAAYLHEQRPFPLRMAAPVGRGPSPPDPFPPAPLPVEKPPEPEALPSNPADDLVRSLLPAMEGMPQSPLLTPEIPEFVPVDPGSFGQSEMLPVDSAPPVPAPRRLLLETSLPRARVEESIPTFRLPVGERGPQLRLPIAPSPRSGSVPTPPSSATYRRE